MQILSDLTRTLSPILKSGGGVLLRTGVHGDPIWNQDVASISQGYKQLSMVLAGWKDLASTCMLHPQVVLVLQFLKTFWSVVKVGFGGRVWV